LPMCTTSVLSLVAPRSLTCRSHRNSHALASPDMPPSPQLTHRGGLTCVDDEEIRHACTQRSSLPARPPSAGAAPRMCALRPLYSTPARSKGGAPRHRTPAPGTDTQPLMTRRQEAYARLIQPT
jgi:hypothetical protein